MPIIHNNILCVTVDELVECGVKRGALGQYLLMQRQGLVYCWEHHKDGRKVYIHFEALKENYKLLITQLVCDGIEPMLWLQNKEAEKLNVQLDQLCNTLSQMVEVSPADVRSLSDSCLFTPQEVQQIARAAGWCRLWRKMDTKTARSYGFDTVIEVQNEMFKRCLNEQMQGFVKFPKPVNNERVLDRKAREYSKDGLDCLIGGYFGNVNREKINPVVHAALMELASSPLKFSFEDIGMFYNGKAIANGLPRMTVSAIKQHLNKPKNKRVWQYGRHGKIEVDLLVQPQIERKPVSRPDALWTLDGTAMQLYYRGADGKVKSDLYVYFVVDVYSSAIIGYSVAFQETSNMVVESLKMAIDRYGYAPYQLQYDKGAANMSGAIQGIMNNMSRVHFPCAPHSGNHKYTETYIGHFQQRVLRYHEEFKGGNITTTSLNSKANPELLKVIMADDNLKSESEIVEMFGQAVNDWNSRGEKRDGYGEWVGEKKIERYMHEHADRVQLNYFEKISLFMAKMPKPYKYMHQGIKIKKTNYIVPDLDGIGDFEFNRLHLGQEFEVRLNPLHTDFITLYANGKYVATAHQKDKYAACAADMKGNTDASKIKLFVAKQEQYGYEHAVNEMERQREILSRENILMTGTDGIGWHDTPKNVYNKQQEAVEDARNGVNSEPVDARRIALMNM